MQINHYYMRDMYTKSEIEDICSCIFVNDLDWKKRTVNGIEYRDPDYNCHQLYDDLNEIFYEGVLIKTSDPYDCGQLVLQWNNVIRLTADYIGPSLTSMKRAGINDDIAWKIVNKCRTIGGHLLWPRMSHGINPSKAASGKGGYGISDRIDIALYEIKCFLDKKIDSKVYNSALRNSLCSNEQNGKWFGNFTFSDFCDFFLLKGSFVDENYDIIWFADPGIGKIDEQIMLCYSINNIEAIEKRNCVIRGKKSFLYI